MEESNRAYGGCLLPRCAIVTTTDRYDKRLGGPDDTGVTGSARAQATASKRPDLEEGACGVDGGLEVLCQPSIAPNPCEEPLDDPAPRVNSEADLIGVLAHDLDRDQGGHCRRRLDG